LQSFEAHAATHMSGAHNICPGKETVLHLLYEFSLITLQMCILECFIEVGMFALIFATEAYNGSRAPKTYVKVQKIFWVSPTKQCTAPDVQ
jgi:hypothetical protein